MKPNEEYNLELEYNLQWFAKDGDGGEKTEPATAKKLKEARDDGKVAKSRELNSALDLIVLFLVLKIFVSYVGNNLISVFTYVYKMIPDFLKNNSAELNSKSIVSLFNVIFGISAKIVLPFFAFGFIIAILANIVQVGWKVTTKPLQPKADKFNPINGFKRMFSKDSLFELLKSIAKILVIIYVAYTSIKDKADNIFLLYDIPLMQAVILCGTIIIDAGFKISMVYLVIGLLDFAYQKHKFNEEMKMTKQEGNPEIKGRQKQRMREASQRRMMQDVPKADVVITNPTHLAVAIKYDAETSKAPVVLAKGEDYVAMKIREAAKENQIEIVENKPLARMLYANVEIGQEIPPELYQAVAEVLAMVYNMKNH